MLKVVHETVEADLSFGTPLHGAMGLFPRIIIIIVVALVFIDFL